jgi:outer membrane protein assembly factor BamB
MTHRNWHALATTALLASAAFIFAGRAASQPSKGDPMTTDSLYPTAFSSPRQDSHMPSVARGSGQLLWSRELGMKRSGGRLDLLLFGSSVVVSQAASFALFSADGGKIWEQDKQPGSPVVIANGLGYFTTAGLMLNAVDAAGEWRMRGTSLPAVLTKEHVLMLLWPRKDDYITAVDMPDPRYDLSDDAAAVYDPHINVARSTYGHRTSDWVNEFYGIVSLPPLFVPETSHWLVAQSKTEVTRVDLSTLDSGDTPARSRIPLDKAQAWSADTAGGLVVAGTSGGAKALVKLDVRGAETWRWTDPQEQDAWATTQPPIRGNDGRVFVLTDGRVLAIDLGKLAWQFDAGSDALRHGASEDDGSFIVKDGRLLSTFRLAHGTALGDGSILVVGNRTLFLVEADGRKRFQRQLPSVIVSPPVVDAEGNIYVATATQLHKIR